MKFITIGELLLRLSPPNYEKIRTTSSFLVHFGGADNKYLKKSIYFSLCLKINIYIQ